VAGALTVGGTVHVTLPGGTVERVTLAAGGAWRALPGSGVRLRGAEGPGVVVEAGEAVTGTGAGGTGEGRRLLLPGERLRVGARALEVPGGEGDPAARARLLLRSALRGEVARAGPCVAVRSGPAAGSFFPLAAEDVVGRGAGCSLVLLDPTLSRRHARIRRSGADVTVEDLGARNGVRVGRRRVRRRRLRPGDELRLGGTVLVLVGERPAREVRHREPRRIRWPGPLAAAAAILGAVALALVAAGTLG